MSTWDDKPNDYDHAVAIIERLTLENENLRLALAWLNTQYGNQDLNHQDYRVMVKQITDEALEPTV